MHFLQVARVAQLSLGRSRNNKGGKCVLSLKNTLVAALILLNPLMGRALLTVFLTAIVKLTVTYLTKMKN